MTATANPRIFHLLHMAHRALFRAADRLLADRHDITAAQNGLLLYLEKHDGASMGEAANALGLKKAAVSGLVDRMEKRGLIQRRASATDGRSTELVLKGPGRDIAERSHALIRATNDHMLEGFSEAEQETIARFLTAVTEKANAYKPGATVLDSRIFKEREPQS